MQLKGIFPAVGALAIGAVGGLAAAVVGLPAPWLVGATILVTIAGVLGFRATLAPRLRDAGFAVIGLSIGSGVDGGILDRLLGWTPSLLAVIVSCSAIMWSSSRLLVRYGALDRATAKLASSPGAFNYTLSLALDGRGDIGKIMILQSSRLLVITAMLPPLLHLGGLPADGVPVTLTLAQTVALFAVAFPIGVVGSWFKVPASCLMAGMVTSAIAHGSGLAHGLVPHAITTPVYVVTGVVIGLRFAGSSLGDLRRLLPVAAAAVALAIAIAALFALGLSLFTGMAYAQALIVLAPGGVEAMAAIALALGFDPAFVAAHHLLRICFLSLAMPLWLGPAEPRRTLPPP
ncbi:MAG: hypothetical protein GC191_11760 [Azospirillum sp.]|nr:hypothetical protein [Azospirillum sp.]